MFAGKPIEIENKNNKVQPTKVGLKHLFAQFAETHVKVLEKVV